MSKKDKYKNFAELARYEIENVDYRVVVQPACRSTTAIIAPHGGKIEFLTSELARAIAKDDHGFYAFEGTKSRSNSDLHVTSPNFDEPKCLNLLASSDRVVAIHGLAGDAFSVQVGGRDEAFGAKVHEDLQASGFKCGLVRAGDYGGMSASNICNRGRSKAGVQLEIEAGLRNLLSEHPERFEAFVACVRNTLSVAGLNARFRGGANEV